MDQLYKAHTHRARFGNATRFFRAIKKLFAAIHTKKFFAAIHTKKFFAAIHIKKFFDDS